MKNKILTLSKDKTVLSLFMQLVEAYRRKPKKYCNKCNIALPLCDFPKGKNTCKPCQSEYNKAYNTGQKQPKVEKRIVSKYESKQGKLITGIKENKNMIIDWDCLNYEN